MQLCIFTEPQEGATYDDLRRVAKRAEDCGFDGFFRSDHYMSTGSADGLPGPTDAWITLAALAVETSRVRLGTLVTPVTFRHPGSLAISVAQVDQMSGGRVELGLGTGWHEREHAAYGLPFPPTGTRFDMLAEQLAIVTGLWATPEGERFSFDGGHYTVVDSPARPHPVQRPGPPVIIGGNGTRRTPELAARFADEFNSAFRGAEVASQMFAIVRAACAKVGRAESGRAPIRFSAAATVCCGRTEAEALARAERNGHNIEALHARGLFGTPEQVAERIRAFGETGADRLYLQIWRLADVDHVDAIAEVRQHLS
jgi:F420-dependent oxidoreductase-like protein